MVVKITRICVGMLLLFLLLQSLPPVFVGKEKVDAQYRKRVRLVEKRGTTNISHSKIPGRWSR